MGTIFRKSENSNTSDPHRQPHRQICEFTMHVKIKKTYKNNKFRISTRTWNEEFQLPDGSYSVSDMQDYFEYIIKKHETVTDNSSVMIYVKKIKHRIRLQYRQDIILNF